MWKDTCLFDILESSTKSMELIVKFPHFQGFDNMYMIPSTKVEVIIVTAQPYLNHNPPPTQQKVGWDTVITKKPPTSPHPPTTNSNYMKEQE